MTDAITEEMIEENRPTYKEGERTHYSIPEFLAIRALQLSVWALISPLILIMVLLAVVSGGLPSYQEIKRGIRSFATDRSRPQYMCAHEWEFVRGTPNQAEPAGLQAEGLRYKVYDSLWYECPHCGKSEWVQENETFRTIKPDS